MKHARALMVHIAVSFAGLALAAGSTWMVVAPQWHDFDGRHGWGGRICDRFRPMTGYGNGAGVSTRIAMCGLNTQTDGIRVGFVDLIIDGCFEPSDGAFERSCDWIVSFGESFRDRGFWAPTLREYQASFLEESPHAESELPALGGTVLDALADRGFETIGFGRERLIETGEWEGTRVVWKGWAINAGTVVGLGMWVGFMPVVVRDARRMRWGRLGRCARCGYDLRGIKGAVCPECGGGVAGVSAREDTD